VVDGASACAKRRPALPPCHATPPPANLTPPRKEHGEEDTYAFACAVADLLFFTGPEFKNKDSNELKYRTFCLPDMERPRRDVASLEYVVWRMTQGKWEDREHSIPAMKALLGAVTHLEDGGPVPAQ
jgi:hypothetical protein